MCEQRFTIYGHPQHFGLNFKRLISSLFLIKLQDFIPAGRTAKFGLGTIFCCTKFATCREYTFWVVFRQNNIYMYTSMPPFTLNSLAGFLVLALWKRRVDQPIRGREKRERGGGVGKQARALGRSKTILSYRVHRSRHGE